MTIEKITKDFFSTSYEGQLIDLTADKTGRWTASIFGPAFPDDKVIPNCDSMEDALHWAKVAIQIEIATVGNF